MIIYKCMLSGDEMFTSCYPMELKDGLYRVRGKLVDKSSADIDTSLIGSSTEPTPSSEPENSQKCVDVIQDSRLVSAPPFDKRVYAAYFKAYFKSLLKKHQEKDPSLDSTAWKAEINTAFQAIYEKLDQFQFFMGESMNQGTMYAALIWQIPEGETEKVPFVWFYKQGLTEIEV